MSDWRSLILLRRATFEVPESSRRWRTLPASVADVHPLLRRMLATGELSQMRGVWQVYQVESPYAKLLPVDELDVLFEVNPWVILSDISALQFHGLTDSNPTSIHVLHGRALGAELLPLGTVREDWIDVTLPERRTPERVLQRRVTSRSIGPNRIFGFGEYQHHGVTLRVTTPERTLLDGLLLPDLSGGILSVLDAWIRAKPLLNPEALVQFVELYGVAVLRQRVGYLMEALGLAHPALEHWQQLARRGGSSKLVGSQPYSSTYSERWSLSLNAPVDALGLPAR